MLPDEAAALVSAARSAKANEIDQQTLAVRTAYLESAKALAAQGKAINTKSLQTHSGIFVFNLKKSWRHEVLREALDQYRLK